MTDEKNLGADAAAVDGGMAPSADTVAPHVAPMLLTVEEELEAVRQFAQQMQRMGPNGQRAAIAWLADFYLGIRLWGRM